MVKKLTQSWNSCVSITSVAGFDDISLFILQELRNGIIYQKKRSYNL